MVFRLQPCVTTLSAFVLAMACAVAAGAQGSAQAGVSGTIRDAGGAVMADASATLRSTATGVEYRATTDVSGRYQMARVAAGDYVLTVEKAGFRRAVIETVTLAVNDALTRDVVLEVGDVTETLTVTGATTGVQTRAGGVSLVVDDRNLQTLPLNGRNWTTLTSLAPGAGLTATAPVSGVRHSYNSTSIDGLGVNNERTAEPLAGASFYAGPGLISTEAIQEFRVITANADATFGRGSGAQVNVITKSGTNALRGSVYEFMRDDALDARDFFNTGPFFDDRGRATVPPLSQHLFGVTVGGPITRGRHFYFGSYEGFRQAREATSAFTFPNGDLIGLVPGDLGAFYRAYYVDRGLVTSTTGPGEFRPLTPTDRAAAIAAGFDVRLFDGNAANGEAGTLLQSTTSPQDVVHDALFVRPDSVLSDGWRLSGRINRTRSRQTGPQFTLGSPIDLAIETRTSTNLAAELTGVLTTTQVLEVRAGWTDASYVSPPEDGVGAAFRTIGVRDDVGILVNAAGTGLNSAGLLGTSSFQDGQRIPQFSLNHSWQRGRLLLRSGLDVSGFTIDIHNGAGRPTYTFTGFVGPNGLLGAGPAQGVPVATSAAASIFGVGGGPSTALRQFASSRQEYFTQADLRLSRDVTMNLGLRYTYTGVYRETADAIANLYAVDPGGATVRDVSPFTYGLTAVRLEPAGTSMYQPDRDNWQPRVGVAWDVAGRHTTAIRAAYGVYDDRFFQLVFSAQGGLVNNQPFTLASNAANVPFVLDAGLPVVTGTPSAFGVDPTIRSPRVHRVTAGVEQEIGAALTVTADYVGSFGRDLFGVADMNGGAGVPLAMRINPRFSTVRLITNTSTSDYHALQVVARRRFRAGVSFTAAYTLATARDDSSAEFFAIFPGQVNTGASSAPGFQGGGAAAWTARPRTADWGAAAGIPRHALAASHIIELPFGPGRRWLSDAPRLVTALVGGWSASGVLVMRSGDPFDLRLGADANDDGDVSDRPALVGGSLGDLYASNGERTQFLVPRDRALGILGSPAVASDPFAVVARNAMTGPAIWSYDVSLRKRLDLSQRVAIAVEVNAFNVFNHANLGAPVATLSDARFGRVVATAAGTTARQIQLGARLTF